MQPAKRVGPIFSVAGFTDCVFLSLPFAHSQVNKMGSLNAQKNGVTTEQLLEKTLERLNSVEKELQRLKDIEEIKVLMNKYGENIAQMTLMLGYYMDRQLYKQVVQLFSTRDDVRGYCHGGIWVGKESIDRMYVSTPSQYGLTFKVGFFGSMFTAGHNGPAYGYLSDHVMAQYVIDIDPDGLTAKGRSRTLMQLASHDDAVKDNPNPLSRESAFRAWWEGIPDMTKHSDIHRGVV